MAGSPRRCTASPTRRIIIGAPPAAISSGRFAPPTLIIQAKDDPFVFPHSLPEPGELAPGTQLELQAKGGHVGFVDGSLGKPTYYLERRIPQWLADRRC